LATIGTVAPGVADRKRAGSGLDRDTLTVAGVVILGVIMSILDTTIVNVALDALSRDLNAPLATIQWVATGYLLALAMVIPVAGWMSERFGAKRVWMVSVALFGLGSALCGVASSAEMLICFRVLQGLGGGMIMPVAMSVLAQTAGPQRIGRIMSVLGVPMLLGPILGPVIGGLIVDSVSWRWIFYVNVPIAVVSLFLAARVLRDDQGRADAGRLDWTGVALLSPGLAGLVLGLSETQSHNGVGAPIAFGPILAGAVLVALFVRHALRARRPLIDVRLFRSRAFRAAAATTFLLGTALFGAMLVIPLYYQVARGQSALDAGLLMAPQGIGAALAMPFTGRLTDRIGGGHVAVAGTVVMALATLPLAAVGSATPDALLAGVLVVRGIGLGGAMMPAMAAAFATLTSAEVPRATSALNALQRVGGSIGTALLAVVLGHQVNAALGGGSGGQLEQLAPGARAHFAAPLADAFAHTFVWAFVISLAAVVPALALARAERRDGAPARTFDRLGRLVVGRAHLPGQPNGRPSDGDQSDDREGAPDQVGHDGLKDHDGRGAGHAHRDPERQCLHGRHSDLPQPCPPPMRVR
jgi:EmrB/QacA subfamily drug resistance transporter